MFSGRPHFLRLWKLPCLLLPQFRTTAARRQWMPAAGGQAYTTTLDRNSNVALRQQTGSLLWTPLAAKPGTPDNSCAVEKQELLWKRYFLDPTLWWDCRKDNKSARYPDFRHKESREPLWLNNAYKPEWVDVQLAVLDERVGRPGQPTSNNHFPLYDAGGHTLPESQVPGTAQDVIQLCENGLLDRAVDVLTFLVETSKPVGTSLLYKLIQKCGAHKNLVLGRRLDDLTVKLGYQCDAFLGNHLLRMYASQGLLQEAMEVFSRVPKPSTFMWFSIISAQAKHGKPGQAIQLYHEMRASGLEPNGHIFAAALHACARAEDVESGRQVHAHVLASGMQPNAYVFNCLVDMFVKCGQLEDARTVFDSMSTRNEVTWTTMMNGYADHELGDQALALYVKMEQESLSSANCVTFSCLLKACASAGALQQGRQLHTQIVERGLLEHNIVVGNCLVNMYAKCGKMDEARAVFDSLAARDVITWTAMINGYGRNNEGPKALACFEEMMDGGVQPVDTTFTCLLVACSNEGLVSEGRHYFDAMVRQHGHSPTIEHYTCMVDLLGRAGHLDEAEKMLLSVDWKNDAVGLTALMKACKVHGDIERGIRCFQSLVQIDAQNAGAYVLMANMYADADKWADVERIERLRKLAGARKKPAVAGIEVNKQVQTFVVGDERDDVSLKLRSTNARLKEEGNHVPHTKGVLKPMSEKEKEDDLCGHAEKLALAYGLLNTPDGTPLLVTKNLLMCQDCHSSTEIMSKVEKRNIVVRDAYRVHRFEAGFCSCKGRC